MHAKLTPKYVTNEKGRRTEVILPVGQYDALLEDLKDLAAIAERRDEPPVTHKKLLAQLKKEGLL